MHVLSLHRYPIKSMDGELHTQMRVVSTGFEYDRQWMVVDAASHVFVTQRKDPILARFTAYVSDGRLFILFDGNFLYAFPVDLVSSTSYRVEVHKKWQLAVDVGDAAARVLSEVIGRPVRLVKKASVFDRSSPDRTDVVEVALVVHVARSRRPIRRRASAA